MVDDSLVLNPLISVAQNGHGIVDGCWHCWGGWDDLVDSREDISRSLAHKCGSQSQFQSLRDLSLEDRLRSLAGGRAPLRDVVLGYRSLDIMIFKFQDRHLKKIRFTDDLSVTCL